MISCGFEYLDYGLERMSDQMMNVWFGGWR